MSYQYDHNYDPPAPVIRVTVRSLADSHKQVMVDALVDTGADITCLPKAVVKALGGEPASTYSVAGVNGTSLGPANSCFLEFEIASTKKVAEAISFGDELILGRNILNELTLQLDGPACKLSIMFDTK